MTDKDHASYFNTRFRAIVTKLDGAWDDRNLRNQYYQKIAPRLHTQFVSVGVPVPAKLDALITKVDCFDRAYWADHEMTRVSNALPPPAEKKVIATPTTTNSAIC